MRRTAAVLVLAALVVGACSGSNEAATTEPTATPAPMTAVEESTTTTTKVTTTAVETTDAPPPTSVDDEARLRAAEQAYIASWEAYHAAILDPSDPDLRAEVERTFTGGNLKGVLETLDGYVAAGYVARIHPEILAEATVITPALPIPGEPDRVDMIVCEINSEAYFEVGTAPNGGDSLVRDEVVNLRILARMRFADGRWRSESGERLSRVTGDDGCSD